MSPPIQRVPSEDSVRQLETIVLTQVRDSMALVNANMSKMSDQMGRLNDNVTQLNAQDFAAQIRRTDDDRVKETDKIWKQMEEHNTRITAQAVQLARFGMGMAISASVGSLALGATIVIVINKIFGGH